MENKRMSLARGASLAVVAALASPVAAAVWTNPAGGDFQTGSNWDTGSVPGQQDWVYFQDDKLTTGTVTFSSSANTFGMTLKNTTGTITLDVGAGNTFSHGLYTIMGDGATPALQKPSLVVTSGQVESTLVLIGNNDHTEGHVTVTGPTAIYKARGTGGSIRVGSDSGSNSTMLVANGGQAISEGGFWVGLQRATNCSLTVTDPGSKVTVASYLQVGGANEGATAGGNNHVDILAGGEAQLGQLLVGVGNTTPAGDNHIKISGAGSKMTLTGNDGNSATAGVLGYRYSNNTWLVEDGGELLVTFGDISIGAGTLSAGNVLQMTGGTIGLTGAGTASGGGLLNVQRGTFRLDGGTASLPGLVADTGSSGLVELNGGTAVVANANINNGTTLLVGDGTGATATYRMSDPAGTHTFANDLLVQSDGRLEGAATIVGNVTIKGAMAPAAGAGTTKVVGNLTIDTAAGGKVDLADNDLVIDWTGTNQADTVRSYIASGHNGGGGAWTGAGITSSLAAADGQYAIGYADNGSTGFHLASFSGRSVDDSSVLVKFTYAGDTNLDGQVDVIDLGNLATAWQTAGSWVNGDSNYDGSIDVIDLGLLATNWQKGVGSPLGPGSLDQALAAYGLPSVSVPEPATLLTLAALFVLPLKRVRR